MTDDDLEVFGAIRDRVIRKLEEWLNDDWTDVLVVDLKEGRLLISLSGSCGCALETLIGDAISEAVAMVRSGKDKEIIAQLDARDAVAVPGTEP